MVEKDPGDYCDPWTTTHTVSSETIIVYTQRNKVSEWIRKHAKDDIVDAIYRENMYAIENDLEGENETQ